MSTQEPVSPGSGNALPLELIRPPSTAGEPRGSALVLDGGPPELARAIALGLAAEGHLVGLAPPPDATGRDERGCATALAEAAAELGRLPDVEADRVGLVGLAEAATTALYTGSTRRGLAAVAAVAGRVTHAQLSPQRPVQPVEMLLGLDAPLFVALGTAARERGEVELLRQALDAGAKRAEVIVLDRGEPELLAELAALAAPAAQGGSGPEARACWTALTRFLVESLA